ncbi:MAG: sigma-70 family RNA polymerase sigma factor [Actinomycetota bacterium]|nr:sigma-70 family RNA polymerase sigma factor [Actinomycetota bacterium]
MRVHTADAGQRTIDGELPAEGSARRPPGASRKPAVDELVIIARAQQGDPRAFETLVLRYQQQMYAVALRILADPDDAEDAAQNAFIAAWRQLPEFRLDSKFSSWMYRIVTNRALNQVRARTRRATPVQTTDLELHADGSWRSSSSAVDPEQHAERVAMIDAIRRALAGLPEELRLCWLLREVEQCPYQDIADITRVSLDTARGRIYRARLRLAEAMKSWR